MMLHSSLMPAIWSHRSRVIGVYECIALPRVNTRSTVPEVHIRELWMKKV